MFDDPVNIDGLILRHNPINGKYFLENPYNGKQTPCDPSGKLIPKFDPYVTGTANCRVRKELGSLPRCIDNLNDSSNVIVNVNNRFMGSAQYPRPDGSNPSKEEHIPPYLKNAIVHVREKCGRIREGTSIIPLYLHYPNPETMPPIERVQRHPFILPNDDSPPPILSPSSPDLTILKKTINKNDSSSEPPLIMSPRKGGLAVTERIKRAYTASNVFLPSSGATLKKNQYQKGNCNSSQTNINRISSTGAALVGQREREEYLQKAQRLSQQRQDHVLKSTMKMTADETDSPTISMARSVTKGSQHIHIPTTGEVIDNGIAIDRLVNPYRWKQKELAEEASLRALAARRHSRFPIYFEELANEEKAKKEREVKVKELHRLRQEALEKEEQKRRIEREERLRIEQELKEKEALAAAVSGKKGKK